MNIFLKNKLKKIFKTKHIDYLLVNSTNQWLEETPDIKESSVYKLTGFKGDTGDVLIDKNLNCYLFIDGRYHIQAENETKKFVKIIKLQAGQNQDIEISKIIDNNSNFGIFSKKISYARFERIKTLLKEKNINFIFFDNDFINNYDVKKDKNYKKTGCKPRKINFSKSIFISNLEQVSYLTQYRSFKKEGSSKIYAKLFIDKNNKQTLFKNNKQLKKFFKNYNEGVYIEKNISMYDFNLIKKPIFEDLKINEIKSIKTNEEINALKKAFKISDKSLIEVRDFINKNDNLTEYDIYKKLTSCFFKNGATGLSFKPIVAINQNSASAHYNKFSKKVKLKNGDIVLIDCGVYTKEGLATDTTRVFVKESPSDLQKKVYTNVLKVFLNCYKNENKTGYELNKMAHDILDKKIKASKKVDDFFVFNHGLGHGIGVSVHENPPSLSFGESAKKQFQKNMCFTIEPGLYHKNHFGIRLENSFYRYNNKNISFTKIGFEKKMIIFEYLTNDEKKLLKKFKLLD